MWMDHPLLQQVEQELSSYVLTCPDGEVIEYAFRFAFLASNNEAEYEALIISLKLAKELRILEFKVFSDSQLIIV